MRLPLAACRRTLAQALEGSGKILRRHFGRARVSFKGRANMVTQADLESQGWILSLIRSRFPDHDYLAEEDGAKKTGARHVWVVDPLDGTTNYAHGYPVCCVSIALLEGVRPLLAGVYDPFREEVFLAEAGAGASLNGRSLRVSKARRLSDSLLITGFAYDRAERSAYYAEIFRDVLTRCHDLRRSGSAALDLAWVAAGRADGFWEQELKPWDVAAGLLLVREAGGRVGDFDGKGWDRLECFGRRTLATNGRLHAELATVLRRHP
ncbi:MAG: inositol monophosphatase [Elusimicrobia bacterium]|nr:inositol monophosphatase [Elusimicrobiota bacterium]MDE2237986.1 inositol monophosphatase [Elusimicrobiota bacterium]MDE2426364.1 inositol monophosphatase [Elusimicrobiota bacterium]